MRRPTRAECDLAARTLGREYDLAAIEIEPIESWNSTVFRIDTAHGRYAVRAHEPSQHDRVVAELAFLRHLSEHAVRAPVPIASGSGTDVAAASSHEGVPVYYTVTTWVDGVVRRDQLGVDDAHRLGSLLARLHRAARTFTVPVHDEPDSFDPVHILRAAPAVDISVARAFLPPDDLAILCTLVAMISTATGQLEGWECESGVLHKDFILGNCLWQDGELAVLDFADLGIGPFLYDLAPMLTNIGDQADLRAGFIAGYEAVSPLSTRQVEALPLLEAVRHLSALLGIADKALRGEYGPAPEIHVPYRLDEIKGILAKI